MTALPPETPPAPPRADLVLRAGRRLLRPLVRLLIGAGITFPVFADMLRRLYVDVAMREALKDAPARTDSRISLITGIHRKELRALRERPEQRDAVPLALSRGSLIVARWLAEPLTIDAHGQPLALPRIAEHGLPSFDALVSSVTTDVRPRTVLDDFVAQGVAAVGVDGLIRLNMAAFVPQPGDVMQMFYFGRNLADHVAAACANVSSAGAAPFLDRSVHYDGLSEAQAAALEAYAREKAQLLLLDVNRTALAMLDSGEARAPGALRRVNLGVYLFKCDDLPPDPGQPT